MKIDYILDTNILVHLFAGNLKDPIPNKILAYSVITGIELFSYPNLSKRDEEELYDLLSNMREIPLTEKIKLQTIQLRKEHKTKLPDAIISATAMAHHATLLTNDKHLLSIPKLNAQSLKTV